MAHGQDEELARLEEEAARKLQERMAAELEDLAVEDLLPQVSVAPDVPASQETVLCICGCEGEWIWTGDCDSDNQFLEEIMVLLGVGNGDDVGDRFNKGWRVGVQSACEPVSAYYLFIISHETMSL